MARYKIDQQASHVAIEVTDVAGHEAQLLEAFSECQAGRCSCPTDEYQKLAHMEVEEGPGTVRLRLEPKPGETFDTAEIDACLDSTTRSI